MTNLKKLVQELEIDTRVVFLGKILDEKVLIHTLKGVIFLFHLGKQDYQYYILLVMEFLMLPLKMQLVEAKLIILKIISTEF